MSPEDFKPMNKTLRRDIELILLGVAIGSPSRDKVLQTMPPGSLSNEIDGLLSCLRPDASNVPLIEFLADRKVVIEKGGKPASAICEAIHKDNTFTKVAEMTGQLNHAMKICDPVNLRERLADLIEKLDTIIPAETT